MLQEVGIYEAQDYTAYMYPRKIVIETRLQAFRIFYHNPMSKTHLNDIKIALLSGKVKSVTDIADLCNPQLTLENCRKQCSL